MGSKIEIDYKANYQAIVDIEKSLKLQIESQRRLIAAKDLQIRCLEKAAIERDGVIEKLNRELNGMCGDRWLETGSPFLEK
jgi:hypothetical protein